MPFSSVEGPGIGVLFGSCGRRVLPPPVNKREGEMIEMGKTNEYDEIDLGQLLEAMWKKAWAIVLAAILGGGVFFAYAKFMITPLYVADAQMYVNNSSVSFGNTSLTISSAELSAAKTLVDTYIVILNSRDTLNEVIRETGVPYTYHELAGMVKAGAVNNTEVFSITVTSPSPQEAELIANAIVKVLPIRIADIVDGSDVRVVHYAIVPTAKVSPNITRYTAIGMLVGVIVACAVICVMVLRDTLIHNEDYLMDTYGLPVLAVIPDLMDHSGGVGYYYQEYGRREGTEADKT